MCHQYPTIWEATRAVVRIHGPLLTGAIHKEIQELNVAEPYNRHDVQIALAELSRAGEIKVSGNGWIAKRAKGAAA